MNNMKDFEPQGIPNEDSDKPTEVKEPTDKWNIFAKCVAEIDGKYRWGQYIINRAECHRTITNAITTDIMIYKKKPVVKFTYPVTNPEKFTTEYLYKKI